MGEAARKLDLDCEAMSRALLAASLSDEPLTDEERDPVWTAMLTSPMGRPLTQDELDGLAEAEEDVRAGRIVDNDVALTTIERMRAEAEDRGEP